MWDSLYPLFKRKHRACFLKAFSLLHAIEVKSIVEIGVFRGKNAQVFREMFPDAHLYLVDPWLPDELYMEIGGAVSEQQTIFKQAFERVTSLFKDDPNVTIIRKPSIEAVHDIPPPLDLVFIDANHAYAFVKQNILAWQPKLRLGGILSGHNYGQPRLPGVTQAVQEIFGNAFIHGQDDVWIHRVTHRRGLEPLTT